MIVSIEAHARALEPARLRMNGYRRAARDAPVCTWPLGRPQVARLSSPGWRGGEGPCASPATNAVPRHARVSAIVHCTRSVLRVRTHPVSRSLFSGGRCGTTSTRYVLPEG